MVLDLERLEPLAPFLICIILSFSGLLRRRESQVRVPLHRRLHRRPPRRLLRQRSRRRSGQRDLSAAMGGFGCRRFEECCQSEIKYFRSRLMRRTSDLPKAARKNLQGEIATSTSSW